jgi:4-amino-4-deoxy-L-arabinose transferase-like glycosyltransferase
MSRSAEPGARLPGAGSMLLVAALTAACLVPFATKAFHIDDPLFLWMAQQIRSEPLDPYGFTVNWYGRNEPASAVIKNPPGMGYVLAAVTAAGGTGEVGLHLALLLPAVGMLLGTFLLARELGADSVLASLAALCNPVFLISATQVMSDVPMVCLWVWALWLWMRGLEDGRSWKLAAAATLAAACALTKYFGASLVPLLLIHGWLRRRAAGAWMAWLSIPILLLGLYQLWSAATYGRGLLFDAAAYATGGRLAADPRVVQQALTGLAFAGGGLSSVLFLSPWLGSRRVLGLGGAAWVAAVLLPLASGGVGSLVLRGAAGIRWGDAAQLGLFVVVGLAWLALAFAELRSARDAGAVLLAVWLLGTFVFATFVNWTVNGRSVLPMVPAAGLLLARRLGAPGSSPRRAHLLGALALALVLALLPTWADFRLANTARDAAARATASGGGSSIMWFSGHWGFQYYMQGRGALPIQADRAEIDRGELVVTPSNNTNVFVFPAEAVTEIETLRLVPSRWISTMDLGRAGFHTDVWGPLPYAFGPAAPEKYTVSRVVQRVRVRAGGGADRGSGRP